MNLTEWILAGLLFALLGAFALGAFWLANEDDR